MGIVTHVSAALQRRGTLAGAMVQWLTRDQTLELSTTDAIEMQLLMRLSFDMRLGRKILVRSTVKLLSGHFGLLKCYCIKLNLFGSASLGKINGTEVLFTPNGVD